MPRATINIGDAAGQAATNATWKYAIGFVPGQENEGLVANGEGSPCRLPGYDDSGWETCQDLSVGISSGFTFAIGFVPGTRGGSHHTRHRLP